MARMMSERAAWLWLAERWKSPSVRNGTYFIRVHVKDCRDLLWCVLVLYFEEKISFGTEIRMFEKAEQTRKHPHTAAGARARARFCERQAAKLERKPTTKKGKTK